LGRFEELAQIESNFGSAERADEKLLENFSSMRKKMSPAMPHSDCTPSPRFIAQRTIVGIRRATPQS
jgi:hypothetical protein